MFPSGSVAVTVRNRFRATPVIVSLIVPLPLLSVVIVREVRNVRPSAVFGGGPTSVFEKNSMV